MSKLELIRKTIKQIPRGKPFFTKNLSVKYPSKDLSRVLSSLVKKEEIKRVIRGIYVRPERNRFLPNCAILPSSDKIVEAISKKTGEIISVHGAVALNRIGLSTQVPARAIYHTTGRSRYVKINENFEIKLVHINPKKLVMPGTVTCYVVNALWFEGKSFLTPAVVKRIHHRIGNEHFSEVVRHLNKMPAWMRVIFLQYQCMKSDDPRLKKDLDEYY